MTTAAIILAAGKGTRMYSAVPKVLHSVAGRPMVRWVLDALRGAGVKHMCLVLSEERQGFEDFLAEEKQLTVAVQKNRLGTGDAVASAAWSFAGVAPASYAEGGALSGPKIQCDYVLVATADTPAIAQGEIKTFLDAVKKSGQGLGVLGMRVPDPKGYGRLVAKGQELISIVEEKDADPETKKIDVCNTGYIACETALLFSLLHDLKPDNAQKEYYLTDVVKHARSRGLKPFMHVAAEFRDFAGINDRAQLADVEHWLIKRKARELMAKGVSIHLPDTVYIESTVEAEADSDIGSGCRLLGKTRIGSGAQIGAGSVIQDTVIHPGEKVPPLSVRSGL